MRRKIIGIILVLLSVVSVLIRIEFSLSGLPPLAIICAFGLGIYCLFGNAGLRINEISTPIMTIDGEIVIPWFMVLSLIASVFLYIYPSKHGFLEPLFDGGGEVKSQVDTYYFGYTPDASPFSLQYGEVFSGYCHSLFVFLQHEAKENKASQLYDHELKEVDISNVNRFQRKAFIEVDGNPQPIPENSLIVECGASTITNERKSAISENHGGEFSIPFAQTGAKMLINKTKLLEHLQQQEKILVGSNKLADDKRIFGQGELTENEKNDILKRFLSSEVWEVSYPSRHSLPLSDQKILIIRNTTTSSLISHIYPDSKIERVNNRGMAIARLKSKENLIYSSDEILLLDMVLNTLKDDEDEYFIGPDCLLSHENYGIVVYDVENNRGILDKVNTWIETQGQEAYEKFVAVLFAS